MTASTAHREQVFTRVACAELLLDAGAVVMPSVCEGLIESRARGLLELFRRKGLLPCRPTLPSTFLPSSASSAMDRSNRTDATARCSKRQAHMNASLTAVRPFPFSSREVRTASRSPSDEWNLSVPSCSSCLSIHQLRRIGCRWPGQRSDSHHRNHWKWHRSFGFEFGAGARAPCLCGWSLDGSENVTGLFGQKPAYLDSS